MGGHKMTLSRKRKTCEIILKVRERSDTYNRELCRNQGGAACGRKREGGGAGAM